MRKGIQLWTYTTAARLADCTNTVTVRYKLVTVTVRYKLVTVTVRYTVELPSLSATQ